MSVFVSWSVELKIQVHAHLRPSIEPAKAPPIALLYESSFLLRFAAASLVNMYAPPIAAARAVSAVLSPNFMPPGLFTKDSNGASCAGENAPGPDVLLRQRVLHCGYKRACAASNCDSLDGVS
jgi:hypothetical protein